MSGGYVPRTSIRVHLHSHPLLHIWIYSKDCLVLIVSWNTWMIPFLSMILELQLDIKPDFFDYVQYRILVCSISKVNEVMDIGTTTHKFVDTKGQFVYLPQVTYHLPSSKVCLVNPQVLYQNCGGKSILFVDWFKVKIHLTNWNQNGALKLRRRSMGFLWVEAWFFLEVIIFLMPSLVVLLPSKKHPTHRSNKS